VLLRVTLTFVLFMASMGFLDSMAIYRAASHLGADPMYLGIMSFSWSAIYIVSAILFGYLGDRYRVRVLGLTAASAELVSAIYILYSGDLLSLFIGYVLHAVASSSGRIAVSIDVLEIADREVWGELNLVLRGIYWLLRGGMIYAASRGSYGTELGAAASLAASALIALIPEALPLGRRFIYRLEDAVEKYYSAAALRGFTVLSILEGSPGRYRDLEYIWSRWGYRGRSPAVIAISSSLLAVSAELILTPAPSVLSSSLGPGGLAQYLVGSSLLMGCVLIAVKMAPSITTMRGPWGLVALAAPMLIALRPVGVDSPLAICMLALFMLAYNMLEASNYNAYSQATSGYELGKYQAIREVGGLIGGIASGYIASHLGYGLSLYIGAIAAAIAILIGRGA